MDRQIYSGVGKYGVPALPRIRITDIDGIEDLDWFTFKDSKNFYMEGRNKKHCGVQFFLDDKWFNSVWTQPDKYIEHFRMFGAVAQPDFSLYTDWPLAMQIWNHYRKQWVAAHWTAYGIKVIPTVCWSTPESYEFSFDGVPKHSVVCCSSTGIWKSDETYRLYLQGYAEMKRRVQPDLIIMRGKIPGEFAGDNIIRMNEQGDMHFSKRHTKSKKIKIRVR